MLCLLVVVAAVAAQAADGWAPVKGRIITRWGKQVTPSNVLPEYPRPMMVRRDWLNLNGLWQFEITKKDDAQPSQFGKQILVPFPPESSLSGIGHMVMPDERIWYKRTFANPRPWCGRRVMLNFGAVDYECIVWVNGKQVGKHQGGFDPFSFDITDALKPAGEQEIVVTVWDPTDSKGIVRGKQTLKPQGCFYTPTSGIWQTVWLEPVQDAHIVSFKAVPDIDRQVLRVNVTASGASNGAVVKLTALDGRSVVAAVEGKPGEEIVVPVKSPKLWSPESPFLYDLRVSLVNGGRVADSISSYFGMRKLSVMKDRDGLNRLALNNKIVFQYGPLDQGFWPDGIFTAPADAANRYDIEVIKKFGSNMMRKHIKVEPQRLYYWADKLGLMIWQDMPSGDNSQDLRPQFEEEFRRMVDTLYNHPSIIMWVCFNEGWGQFDTARIANTVRKWDPSRLINNATGWTDDKAGDTVDVHVYPGPGMPELDRRRAAVLGEFGGVGGTYMGHLWSEQGTFAYAGCKDRNAATDTYVDMLYRMRPLIGAGLSAAVYTQITDVEIECNGWMTYDRAEFKLDPKRAAEAASKLYLPAPTCKRILASAEQSPQTWRYTTSAPAGNWHAVGFDDSKWSEGLSGFGTKTTPGAKVATEWTSGDIWIRRTFTLDSLPLRPHMSIHHDEDADVYINGRLAASLKGFTTGYYLTPLDGAGSKLLTLGENTLAIHCHQTAGGQYIDCGLGDLIPPRP